MPTLDQYVNMLGINKLRLDDELEVHAQIQFIISAEVTRQNSRMVATENELKNVEARLFIDIKESDDKGAEMQIKSRVRVHKDRERAWEKYQTARETYEQWSDLKAAWITRGYQLGQLGGLFSDDYFSITSITRPNGERRRELNTADEESRSAIRRASDRASMRQRVQL